MLELKNVSKSFAGPGGQVEALKEVSLSVSPGELVAIRGPSGCGKTTLLLAAGGLLKPSSGTVTIGEQDVYKLSPNRRSVLRADNVGFVFQQFHLIPYLTITDNILAPSITSKRPDAKKRAQDLIRQFNLEHRAGHVPAQLSSGECQRTALARALLNKPKIIFADEPTGNLDEENGKTVLSYLSEFAKQGGAVLIGTHDHKVRDYADRCLGFRYGKLEEA